MNKKEIEKVLELLDKEYGKKPICYLNYEKDYELLVATILSAQCTDKRVNEITKNLFKKYKTIDDFANSNLKELEKDIKMAGFAKSKSKYIKESMEEIIKKYGNVVPSDIDELTKLSGIGRKTANVIRTHIYHIDSIVVDTHVKRVSKLIGFTKEIDPVKIEQDLMKVIPKGNWQRLNSQLMALGRTHCDARKRNCNNCFLNEVCITGKKTCNK